MFKKTIHCQVSPWNTDFIDWSGAKHDILEK